MRSGRRSKQNVAVLNARIAAAAASASRPAAPDTMVLQAARKASVGYAALLCLLALGFIGDFARHAGGSGLLPVLAFVMAAGALLMLRREPDRVPRRRGL
jgi:hypothetical protein